jgi:hypothetical protein
MVLLKLISASAEAKGKGKADKEHKARGKVVAVTAARDGSGSITIVSHSKKGKKGVAAAAARKKSKTKTFQIGPNTIYQAVTKAGKRPITIAAIRKGEYVVIAAANGPADEVDIMVTPKKHKHKKTLVAGLVK